MQDFKESVANVARHAIQRNYPRRLLCSTWSRFLQRRWQSADIRGRELLNWFRRMLDLLESKGVRNHPPNARQPQPSIRQLSGSDLLPAFGRHRQDPTAALPTSSNLSESDAQADTSVGLIRPHKTTRPPRADKGRVCDRVTLSVD